MIYLKNFPFINTTIKRKYLNKRKKETFLKIILIGSRVNFIPQGKELNLNKPVKRVILNKLMV